MGKRYYVELSRIDHALVSYFPGFRAKDNKWNEWIEDMIIPAVKPLAKRKSAKIRETPITFWISVRKTARRRAEIFIFMTPAYPGVVIEKAMLESFKHIKGGNVHAGREPIPEDAVPCVQVFRGKVIRFYNPQDVTFKWFDMPMILWQQNKAPELSYYPILANDEFYPNDVPIEEAEIPLVEGRILDFSNGESCRKFQQALIPAARETD